MEAFRWAVVTARANLTKDEMAALKVFAIDPTGVLSIKAFPDPVESYETLNDLRVKGLGKGIFGRGWQLTPKGLQLVKPSKVKAPAKQPAKKAPLTRLTVILRIDNSPYHYLAADQVRPEEVEILKTLENDRYVRRLPPSGRMPERWVLTPNGTSAVGIGKGKMPDMIARVVARFI